MIYGSPWGMWDVTSWRVSFSAGDVGHESVVCHVSTTGSAAISCPHKDISAPHKFGPDLPATSWTWAGHEGLLRTSSALCTLPRALRFWQEMMPYPHLLKSLPNLFICTEQCPTVPKPTHRVGTRSIFHFLYLDVQTSLSVGRQQLLLCPSITNCAPTTRQDGRAGWDSTTGCVSCSNSLQTCL